MKVGDLVKFPWDTWGKQPKKTGVIITKHPPSMRIANRGDAFDVLVFCTGRPHMFRTRDLEVLNESR